MYQVRFLESLSTKWRTFGEARDLGSARTRYRDLVSRVKAHHRSNVTAIRVVRMDLLDGAWRVREVVDYRDI